MKFGINLRNLTFSPDESQVIYVENDTTREFEKLTTKNYIQKYKEYISFLNENRARLLDADNWDILFQVLPLLKLSPGYTLDDFRSKASTNNILCLYARKTDTRRPSEKAFKRYNEENSIVGIMRRKSKFDFIDNVTVTEDDEENYSTDEAEEADEPLNLPEKILPYEVVCLHLS